MKQHCNQLRGGMLVGLAGLAWLAACVSTLVAPPASPWLRAGLLLLPGLAALGLGAWFFRRLQTAAAACRKSLELLTRLEAESLADDRVVARLSSESPFPEAIRAVQTRLADQAARLQDFEASIQLLELRAQRGVLAEDRLNAVLSGLSDPVLVIDEFGEVLIANPAAVALLQLESATPERRALATLIRCEQLVDLLLQTQRRKVATSRSSEISLADATGAQRNYKVTSTAFQLAPGANDDARLGVVAVFHDISNLKEAQRRHAEFVSAVSHEMKTPLAAIRAYVEMLADGDADDEAVREEFLGVIASQAERLQRLIENLLNLARVESGVVKVEKQNVSLNGLLEEALRLLKPAAEEKKISLAFEPSPLYLSAFGDRDQLLQAAINLVSNAVKYTPPEGKVTLRSRALDKQVQFDVEDTGVGLSSDDCHKVFEKFYRVGATHGMAPGTGLGLPLVKSIVEDVHRGYISVRSEPGAGSTFTVTLPTGAA